MDKQTTAAFILIGIVLVVWLYINAPEPQPPVPAVTDSSQVEESSQQPEQLEQEINKPEPAPQATAEENIFTSSDKEEKIITVENDLVKLELTSKGARIRKYYLKDYNTWYYRNIEDTSDFYNTHVQLINPFDGGDLNLVFVTADGQLINTANLDFKPEFDDWYYNVTGSDSVIFSYAYKIDSTSILKKNFVIYGDSYSSRLEVEMINMNNVISGMRYDLEWSNGINFVEENSVDEANYSKASAYSGEELVVIEAPTDGEKEEKSIRGKVDWIGVRNKYFAVIIAPEEPYDDGGARFEATGTTTHKYGTRKYFEASLNIPFNQLKYQKDAFQVYIGPMKYDLLESYEKDYEAFYDFGSFFGMKFITRPISEHILLPLFQFLHMFIPNYGFVIIVLSIIIKILLYPLTKQSYKSMKRMQQLQPKIAELKKKYEGDQQKIQSETMNLYRHYGINPAGGCLPMVLQMPILFALFTFFNVTIEIRHEPFIFWITNLSSPDYLFTLPFQIPLVGVDKITGLAPLLGITMFLQQKMSVKDPSQKALVYIMPIMFTFLFMGFSSGLNLYYFMFNLLSIGQQYYINHKKGDEELIPVKNPKKSGFMQRMMEAAEKQAQAQKQAQKKRH